MRPGTGDSPEACATFSGSSRSQSERSLGGQEGVAHVDGAGQAW